MELSRRLQAKTPVLLIPDVAPMIYLSNHFILLFWIPLGS